MTGDPLIARFLEGLTHAGFAPTEPLGIAFSGGADSTALLVLARRALPPDQLVALHVDHAVRADSTADRDHCQRVATALGVAFDSIRLEPDAVAAATADHGVEGALRELRYAALASRAAALDLGQVALGHHGDDAVESLLLALTRGAGAVGLGGPRPGFDRRGVRFLRPLLGFSRTELEALVTSALPDHGWREDPTNRDQSLARNRVRHAVVPLLRELAGSAAPLRRSLANLRADRDALEALVARALAATTVDPAAPLLDLQQLLDSEPPWPERVLVEAVRRWVAARGQGRPPARGHVVRVVAALRERGRTRWLALPGLTVRVADGTLAADEGEQPSVEAVSVPLGRSVPHPSLGLTLRASVSTGPPATGLPGDPGRAVVFDADTLADFERELLLRGVRPGDRFRPFGMDGSVRLRRWLADRGIPRADRAFVPVVALGDDILWVVGHRRGAQAPVTASTRRCLVLAVSPA